MTFPLQSLEQMQCFFWILVRVSVLSFLLPFFGARGIPTLWKAGFSLMLAALLTPVVPPPGFLPVTILQVVQGVLSEALMGFLLALGVKLFLSSVQLAGQFLGFQMGFNMARAIDPQGGGQISILSQFLYVFTVLVFFSVNGHHLFIRALASSFYTVPPNTFHLNPSLLPSLVKIGSEMFFIALKMAAPVMVALFLSNLCLGIVARTVPQVNILMIGFPLNIGLGLMLLGLTLNNLSPFLVNLTKRMGESLIGMIRLM